MRSLPEQLVQDYMGKLQKLYESLEVAEIADKLEPQLDLPPEGAARKVETAVPAKACASSTKPCCTCPTTSTSTPSWRGA
jgi:hypothetical protein